MSERLEAQAVARYPRDQKEEKITAKDPNTKRHTDPLHRTRVRTRLEYVSISQFLCGEGGIVRPQAELTTGGKSN